MAAALPDAAVAETKEHIHCMHAAYMSPFM